MFRGAFSLLLVSCASAPACPEGAFDEASMRADVAYLASTDLDGRLPGTGGDGAARAVLAERFVCLGLTPGGDDGYEKPFTDAEGRETASVFGILEGEDSAFGADVVVLSAHLDHLGGGKLGANDNASGLSGLMNIAEALVDGEPPARTVVFAAFGSEESGYEGAADFLDAPPESVDPADVVYNVNLDMIGSYSSTDTVWALGTMAGTPGRTAVDALAADYPELDIGVDEPSDLSDNYEFCTRGVPYVFFWTEDLDCYHETCDTADRVDYANLVEVARLAGDVVAELASTEADLRAGVQVGADVCGF